jgi:hypothetical protein
MMNCSTSALGRCLGMMIPFGKMASFEEVQNRQDEQPAPRAPKIIVDMPNKEVWPVSKKQLQELSELGYGGAVPANWNEAKAIIARMQRWSLAPAQAELCQRGTHGNVGRSSCHVMNQRFKTNIVKVDP